MCIVTVSCGATVPASMFLLAFLPHQKVAHGARDRVGAVVSAVRLQP